MRRKETGGDRDPRRKRPETGARRYMMIQTKTDKNKQNKQTDEQTSKITKGGHHTASQRLIQNNSDGFFAQTTCLLICLFILFTLGLFFSWFASSHHLLPRALSEYTTVIGVVCLKEKTKTKTSSMPFCSMRVNKGVKKK